MQGGSSLRQKAQTSGSISCSSWAMVSERIAFFLPTLAFRFVEKKRGCFSAFLLGGKDLVFRYWWSLPIIERPFATAVAERIWRNAVWTVSLLGAVWITSVSSAMAASAFPMQQDGQAHLQSVLLISNKIRYTCHVTLIHIFQGKEKGWQTSKMIALLDVFKSIEFSASLLSNSPKPWYQCWI